MRSELALQSSSWATSPVSPTAPSTCVPPSKAFEQALASRLSVSAAPDTHMPAAHLLAAAAAPCALAARLGSTQQRRPTSAAARTRLPRVSASAGHAGATTTTLPAPAHAATPALRRSPSAEELVLQYNKARKLGDASCCWAVDAGLRAPPQAVPVPCKPWAGDNCLRPRLRKGLGAAPPPRVSLPPSAADAGCQRPSRPALPALRPGPPGLPASGTPHWVAACGPAPAWRITRQRGAGASTATPSPLLYATGHGGAHGLDKPGQPLRVPL